VETKKIIIDGYEHTCNTCYTIKTTSNTMISTDNINTKYLLVSHVSRDNKDTVYSNTFIKVMGNFSLPAVIDRLKKDTGRDEVILNITRLTQEEYGV
jgi:hypothetical protein